MSVLWPRLTTVAAHSSFDLIVSGASAYPAVAHPEQTFGLVGGRVTERQIRAFHDSMAAIAMDFGFPDVAPRDAVEFDRRATSVVREHLNLTWSEASNLGVWSFSSLVALPDVTAWRWSGRRQKNIERWVATDLTRHTWARLWWRSTVFDSSPELLERLSESDLNQLLERRVIGGDPALLTAMARSVVGADPLIPRRGLIRDATKRVLRALSFVDIAGMAPEQLQSFTDRLTGEAVRGLKGE
jgi:hypothetical protein